MRSISASRTLEFVQRAHHLPEVADARENDLRRPPNARGVANQFVLRADRAQSVLDRAQIAGAVIENRNHNSPFVDGNCSFSRASFEHA